MLHSILTCDVPYCGLHHAIQHSILCDEIYKSTHIDERKTQPGPGAPLGRPNRKDKTGAFSYQLVVIFIILFIVLKIVV